MTRIAPVRRPLTGNKKTRRAATRFSLERLEDRCLLSLVAAYSFDEGSGTVLHDVSGNANNGTITNATWSTAGKFGDALSFTGALNSWVTVPDSSSLNLTTGMTLEAWVDPTSLSSPDAGWASALSKEHQNSSNDVAYALYAAQGTGAGPAGHVLVNGTDSGAGGPSVVPLKSWTFLSATYDGSTLRMYVNGSQVGSAAIGGGITTTGDPLRIGGDWSGEMFTGLIDNVRIYNTALSQSQIQSDMNASVAPAAPVAPAVSSCTPASAATGVATSAAVTATFNQAMLASSITAGDFTLKSASGSTVAATVSYNGSTNTATLTPSARLANSTKYTATISGAQSSSGTPMSGSDTWTFTTGPAPAVTGENPASGATGVATSTAVTATFNEAVQSGTIGFTLTSSSGASVPATVSYNSSTFVATLTPGSALSASTKYTATVSGAKDAAGDPMSGAVSWSFTTAAAAAPVVSSYAPASGATGVATSSAVTAKFNLAMLASSITGSDFTLKTSSGSTVAATVSYNSTTNTATLTPSSLLANSTTYTASISGVESTLGIVIGAAVTWSFTTGPAPAVTSESPASGASGVAASAAVSATFNEAVQSGTINFTLTSGSGSSVPATLSYSASTFVATLTPSSALATLTTYKATVSGAKDAAGDPMTAPVSWSFTTDPPPPTVTAESPASGATGVATSAAVTATFNEAVQASTIAFTLASSSGATVPATVSYNSSTFVVTLTPNGTLANSTKYTATVSAAQNVDGMPMTSSFSWSFSTIAGSAGSPSQEPLLNQSNLQYVGAFRVPTATLGASSFSYGGTAITFNPANNSLFAVGMPYDQAIAEIQIPSTIVNSTNLNNLTTATVLQPFSSILGRIPNNPSSMSSGGYEAIGGLMVSNGKLIGTAFNTYDGTGSVMLSHFELSSLNLASASVSGLYQVGTMGGGFVGGYMTSIPSEWQSALGAPDLTGQAALNIITRTSYGPDAFGFNPANLGSGVTPDIPYLYYDQNHTTLGAWNSNPPTLFNGTVGGDNNTGFGVAFVPGTRSVLFFSAIGTGSFYYGESSGANDSNRTDKGCHSVGGNYAWQVWAYDADDLVAVKNGQENPWDVKPYATWNFNFPIADGSKYMGGVAFDPATGRLYLSELKQDTSNPYAYTPLIQVFQVTPYTSGQVSTQAVAGPAAPNSAAKPLASNLSGQMSPSVTGTNNTVVTASVGSTMQAIDVPASDGSQTSLLGTVPEKTRGLNQSVKPRPSQSSIMPRTNTLLRVSIPRSTRGQSAKPHDFKLSGSLEPEY